VAWAISLALVRGADLGRASVRELIPKVPPTAAVSEAGHYDRANRWDDAAAGGQGHWATRRQREEVIAVHPAALQERQAACSSPTAMETVADGRG